MLPYRKRLRLSGYDYASAGCYFVTIAADSRQPWFGTVHDDRIHPNEAGNMILETWFDLAKRFPSIHLDEAIIMPDHLHGIIVLGYHPAACNHPKLGAIVGAFKSISTLAYGRGVAHRDWPPYNKQLWQTGYNDHIIRTECSLERHRNYIEANPARWAAKAKASLP